VRTSGSFPRGRGQDHPVDPLHEHVFASIRLDACAGR
jgi:hypothetical protein